MGIILETDKITKAYGGFLAVNQVSILFLLALVLIQLIIAPVLSFERDYILYIWTLHLDELFIFILVACAELILMIDQREIAGE